MASIRGWIYVIVNPAMPGLVKVGFSRKDPTLRAEELESTGTPHPFEVVYDALVEDPASVERAVHTHLDAARERKEWFRCGAAEAVAAIRRCTPARIAERVSESLQVESKRCDYSPFCLSEPTHRFGSMWVCGAHRLSLEVGKSPRHPNQGE